VCPDKAYVKTTTTQAARVSQEHCCDVRESCAPVVACFMASLPFWLLTKAVDRGVASGRIMEDVFLNGDV